jgi:hypothetical protein
MHKQNNKKSFAGNLKRNLQGAGKLAADIGSVTVHIFPAIIRNYRLGEAFRVGFGLWGTFGVLFGAISIFNLIVKTYRLGLSSIVKDIVVAYEWTFHRVLLNPIWDVLRISPPRWFNDAVVLWIAAAAIAFRTLIAARRYADIHGVHHAELKLGTIEKHLFTMSRKKYVVVVFTASIFAWPLLWLRFAYSKELALPEYFEGVGLALRYRGVTYRKVWLVQVFAVATLVALLVFTSAGLPPPT